MDEIIGLRFWSHLDVNSFAFSGLVFWFAAANCPVVVGVFWISALGVSGSMVACVIGLLV